jgi:hypothetical protein
MLTRIMFPRMQRLLPLLERLNLDTSEEVISYNSLICTRGFARHYEKTQVDRRYYDGYRCFQRWNFKGR